MLFTLSLLIVIIGIFIISTMSDQSKNLRFSKAIALTSSFIQKYFTRGGNSSHQKVVIVKTSFFAKLKAKLTSPETIISIILTVLFSMASRYFILTYFDVDVYKELINYISVGHFTVLAVVRTFIQLLLEHLRLGINKLTLSMNDLQIGQGDNATASGQPVQVTSAGPAQPAQASSAEPAQPEQAANPQVARPANYWGDPDQPQAGRANGPIDVYDPLGQLTRGYIVGGVNQPVLNNIGSALEDQFLKGEPRGRNRGNSGRLSRAMFTREQERFILDHLRATNHNTWLRIMGVWGYQGGPPRWGKVSNTSQFRSNFWDN